MLPFAILKHPVVIALTAALLGTGAFLLKSETENVSLANAKAQLTVNLATTQTQLNVSVTQNKALVDSVNGLTAEVKQTRATTEVLSHTFDDSMRRFAETNHMLKDIENAPSTDDAPIAPVLRRTLDGLRFHSPSSARHSGGH